MLRVPLPHLLQHIDYKLHFLGVWREGCTIRKHVQGRLMQDAFGVGKLFEALDPMIPPVPTLSDSSKWHVAIGKLIHGLIRN